jgi:hypothetical protein
VTPRAAINPRQPDAKEHIMELASLLKLCEEYSRLGNAVQEQLHDVCDNHFDGLNPNAVELADRFLDVCVVAARRAGDDDLEADVQSVKDDIESWLEEDEEDEDEADCSLCEMPDGEHAHDCPNCEEKKS